MGLAGGIAVVCRVHMRVPLLLRIAIFVSQQCFADHIELCIVVACTNNALTCCCTVQQHGQVGRGGMGEEQKVVVFEGYWLRQLDSSESITSPRSLQL